MGQFFKGYEVMPKLEPKKFKKIGFPDSGDCATALVEVIDGESKLVTYGDDYHDKIIEYIEGFFKGLDYVGIPYEIEELELEDTDMYSHFD